MVKIAGISSNGAKSEWELSKLNKNLSDTQGSTKIATKKDKRPPGPSW